MNKLHVLLVFGGESAEHEVSINSAHNVYAALDDSKYDVSLCFIDRVGRWWLVDSVSGDYIGRPQLTPHLGQKMFTVGTTNEVLRPDVIFPVLHGENGEDGAFQGLVQLLHIPCVGPSLLSAAVTMNKDVTKRLIRESGIPVVDWVRVKKNQARPHFADIQARLGDTVFIKPVSRGSSVGAGKARDGHEFASALSEAFRYDTGALIETALDVREIEVAVLGNETPKISGLGEILPGEEFYSYQDKYSSTSVAHVAIPAQVDDEQSVLIRSYAETAYKAVAGCGMARADFFIEKGTGAIYLNEINSIPGFTNISMYPKLWQAAGVGYSQLIDELIRYATESRV